MAAYVLGMAGRADTPVIPGEGCPIGPGRGPTMISFEGSGLLDLPYDGPEARVDQMPAPAWMSEQARRRPFHLVAVGLLTNVVAALRLRPGFARDLLGLTVMGGILDPDALPEAIRRDIAERGVRAAWPDHNTASDSEAALACARSGIAITWIASEVTFATPLRQVLAPALP